MSALHCMCHLSPDATNHYDCLFFFMSRVTVVKRFQVRPADRHHATTMPHRGSDIALQVTFLSGRIEVFRVHRRNKVAFVRSLVAQRLQVDSRCVMLLFGEESMLDCRELRWYDIVDGDQIQAILVPVLCRH